MRLRRSHYRAKARLLQRRSAMTWETVQWCLANGLPKKFPLRLLRMRITSSLASNSSVQSGSTKSRWNLSLPWKSDFRCSQRSGNGPGGKFLSSGRMTVTPEKGMSGAI